MSWKVKKNIVHYRKISEDKSVAQTVGAILEKDGKLMMRLNYIPTGGGDLVFNLFDPKVKEESSL